MKQKFTKQRCANRHPKKYNFNHVETMPVFLRRAQGLYSFDSDSYDERQEEKKKKEEYHSNPNYLK